MLVAFTAIITIVFSACIIVVNILNAIRIAVLINGLMMPMGIVFSMCCSY